MSDPILQEVAVGILLAANGLVLCGERSHNGISVWEFPGGKVEPAETPLKALEREWLEETGRVDGPWEMLRTVNRGHLRLHFFECHSPEVCDEGTHWAGPEGAIWIWCKLQELDAEWFWPANRAIVDELQGRL